MHRVLDGYTSKCILEGAAPLISVVGNHYALDMDLPHPLPPPPAHQQQQQLQSQANNLLGPALQGLIAQTQGPGGTQADTVTALLTQAQQLQQLQAIQQQLVNNSGVAGGNMAVPAAQMSNVEPTGHNQQQVQFNQVRGAGVIFFRGVGGGGERVGWPMYRCRCQVDSHTHTCTLI